MGSQAPKPPKQMPDPHLGEDEFKRRFLSRYQDPAFAQLSTELASVVAAPGTLMRRSQVSRTRKAGSSFADRRHLITASSNLDGLASRRS